MRSSSLRASLERTFERWMTGALDHTPDAKTDWALSIDAETSSSEAQVTLSCFKRCIRCCKMDVPTCTSFPLSQDSRRQSWMTKLDQICILRVGKVALFICECSGMLSWVGPISALVQCYVVGISGVACMGNAWTGSQNPVHR